MNILEQLVSIIMRQESAYVAGLIAAFTPCVVSLIPIFLYRFGLAGNKGITYTIKEVGLMLLGFLASFGIAGLLLGQLLGSNFVNVTRLVIGTLLVFLGVLQIGQAVNLQHLSRFSNSFVLGLSIPLVISFSPCVLPFMSTLLINASSGVNIEVAQRFILFGLGLLTPAVLIGLGGKLAIRLIRKSHWLIAGVEKISPFLLIISGFYLGSQLVMISINDVLLTMIIVIVLTGVLLFYLFRQQKLRTLWNFQSWLIAVCAWAVIAIVATSFASANPDVVYGSDLLYACLPGSGHTNSVIALPLMTGLTLYAVIVGVAYLWRYRPSKSLRIELE